MSAFQYKLNDCSTNFDGQNPWQDDVLNRHDAVCRLHQIIRGQERSLTICLNGEWGSGKTFFLSRFVGDYNRRDSAGKAVYFNAWQDDFLEDPLVAIVGQLAKVFGEWSEDGLFKDFLNAAVPLFGRRMISVGKQVIRQYCGIDASEVVKDGRDAPERLVSAYHEMEASRKILCETLTKLTERVWADTKAPLLFVVDELDRCRPTFAIEVLERIKHLFSVPHLVFVVGTDIKQLKESIKAVYGEIDADDYLHRFFDLEVSLPEQDKMNYVSMLWEKFGLNSYLESRGVSINEVTSLQDELRRLIKYRRIPLRQIEKCVRNYAFLAQSEKSFCCKWAFLAAVAVVLRVSDRMAYDRFINMRYDLGALIDALYPGASFEELDSEGHVYLTVRYLIKIIYFCGEQTPSSKELQKVKEALDAHHALEFNPVVMPAILETRTSAERARLFQNIFMAHPTMSTGLQQVPEILAIMDKGLRFVDA